MTVSVLRPTNTVTFVQVTSSSGTAAIHTDLSDSSDTTVTRGTADVGYCYLGLQDITLTAGQRVKQVRVRVRRARDAADVGAIEEARVRLYKPSTSKWGPANIFRAYSSTQAEEQGGWVSSDPDRLAWTEPVVDALQAEVTWYASSGNLYLRVAELYVDVDVNGQPVVTAPTVTGANSTTRPSATTTYTDPDGDPQAAARWKVFSAAQYSATNFSPDTSASTWDSGQVGGASTSVTVGTDLTNGTAYRLYVHAAQFWPTVEGPLWWSDWQFTAFTISLVPPAPPALALSTVATAPNNRVLADATAPVNLLTEDNSSFESSLGQWAAETNCTLSRVTTDAAHGTASMQMSSTAAGTMVANSGNEPFLGQHVKGGAAYTALGSARAGTTGRTCRVGIRWQDAAGAAISTSFGSTFTDAAGSYTSGSVTATAPANAKTARVVSEVQATAAAAELHRWDKMDIHAGTSTTWTPGGLGSQVVVVERGERVDTSRGERANWAHPDVAYAGSVRQTTGYGFSLVGDSGRDVLSWEYLDKDIPGGGPSGMLHWTVRSGLQDFLLVGSWPYGGPELSEWQFPVVGGQAHVFSAWVWAASGTVSSSIKLEWLGDDTSTVAGTTFGGAITVTTTPIRYTLTGTCPTSGASAARAVLVNEASANNADVYLTRVGWGLGTTPVDDQPAAGGPLKWTAVRGTTAQQPPGFPAGYESGQRLLFADYEAPPGRPLLYRARLTAVQGGTALSSAYSAYATVLLAAPSRAVLKDPVSPVASALANIDKGDEAARSADAELLHLLGRDRDPVRVTTWRSGLDGGLAMAALSGAEHARLTALLDAANSVVVQWAEGGQSYYTVTGWRSTRAAVGFYRLAVDAVETAAP